MTKAVTKRAEADNGTAVVPAAQEPPVAPSWTNIKSMAEAVQLAELVAKSAALPDVRNAGIAILKMLAGAEMGIPPFASLTGVDIIEGKPAVGAHLKAVAIKRSDRYDYRVVEQDEAGTVCEVAFYERVALAGGEVRKFTPGWEHVGSVRFTIEDAARFGLSQGRDGGLKKNWRAAPADMLFARCVTKGQKRFCPDLYGGARTYDPDELDSPPDVPALPVPAPPALAEAPPADPTTPPADTHGPEMANEQQVARIGELIAELGVTPEQWAKAYQARGVTTARELTRDQASEMILKLEAKRKG